MLPVFEGFRHESYKIYLFQELHQMIISTPFHICNLCGGFVYDCEASTQPERRKTEM